MSVSLLGRLHTKWPICNLSEIASIEYGISKPLDRSIKSGVPIIALPNLQKDGTLNLTGIPYVERVEPKNLLQKGDLLFNWRNGSSSHIGKTAYFDLNGEWTHVGFLLRVRVNEEKIDSRYLLNYLRQVKSTGYFSGSKIQVNRTFNKEELSNLSVVLPPLAEQKKIAEILSTWDQSIDLLSEIITAQEGFLAGIARKVFLRPKEGEGTPFNHVVDAYIDYRGRTPKKLGMAWGGGDIRALSANNVKMGKIDFASECNLGSEDLYTKWMTNGDCTQGDVLLTMEAPLGNVAQIPDNEKYILSQRAILIKPRTDLVSKDYLAHLMRSRFFQNELLRNSSGTTAKGIQRKRLDKIVIYLPELQQQEKVSQLMNVVSESVDYYNQLKYFVKFQKRGLMQQLLTGKTRVKI